MWFSLPPIMPVPGETSFKRIQSHPLRILFSVAFSIKFFVSAANPITNLGRFVFILEIVFKISGFSIKLIFRTSFDWFFLILLVFFFSTRQSETAAEKIAISHGMFASTASNISIAVSTVTISQLSGNL